MAVSLLSHVVSDLTIGKPALPWLPSTASVNDALRALKHLGGSVSELSIWNCSGKICSDIRDPVPVSELRAHVNCRCVGKVCMQTIICHLASEESLFDFPEALNVPVSNILEHNPSKSVVQHVDADASLLEALDLIAKGAQNLIVPITRKTIHNVTQVETTFTMKPRMASVNLSLLLPKDHGGQEYCWLTVEDVLRFLLGSIGVFSPLPAMSIEALGLIRFDVQMIEVEQATCSALEAIKSACQDSSAVAVVDSTKASPGAIRFVGDISCSALQTCNELASLALLTLSAEDFLAFLEDCRKPPQILVDTIHSRVCEILGLTMGKSSYIEPLTPKPESTTFLLHKLEMWGESSSSEDEYGYGSPTGPHDLAHKWHSKHPCSSRKGFSFRNQSGPIFCSPDSSLMAVLLQALAHREHYVWVTREDNLLIGIVNIRDILGVMFNHIMFI